MKKNITSITATILLLIAVGCSNGAGRAQDVIYPVDENQFQDLHPNEIINTVLNRYNGFSDVLLSKDAIDQDTKYETSIRLEDGFVYICESDVRNCIDIKIVRSTSEDRFLLMAERFIKAADTDISDKEITRISNALDKRENVRKPYTFGKWHMTLNKTRLSENNAQQFVLEASMTKAMLLE